MSRTVKYCPGCDSTAIEYLGISECFNDDSKLCDQWECAMCGLSWDGASVPEWLYNEVVFGDGEAPENSNDGKSS